MQIRAGENRFDVVVVGGGHAGSEAALVAARMGCRTALITFAEKSVGEMSCNPAIGGLGKGHLVKEIDALFGEMGRAIDDTGIQFRTLNSSKGPAVRSSRAQADRGLYQGRVLKAIKETPNLLLIEAVVGELCCEKDRICGVKTEEGGLIKASAVVLTTGTFLRGLMHTGEEKTKGGRVGEKASYKLSDSIDSLGLNMGRLKTGTPPRLRTSSIDFSRLVEQPGELPIKPFSFRTKGIERPQISCWITQTNEKTHQIISDSFERSPLFNGQINGTGPRYCPSIEDKVFRFPDRTSHQIFLEPEGYQSDVVYPNGISTSLPSDIQESYVRSISGLEGVEILRWGYAVEYDYVNPQELDLSLKVKNLEGLYLAGQINGTSGYEEAAGQGIIAGINAVHYVREKEPLTLRRDQGYLGVMIDDLTTLGVLEPYRMFTSRAEHRLFLREDNADIRFTPLARKLGLVDDSQWASFDKRMERIEAEKKRLDGLVLKPNDEHNQWLRSLNSSEISDGLSLGNLLKRPEMSYQSILAKFPPEEPLVAREAQRVETELKFSGYLKRQEEQIRRLKKMEDASIPLDFDYADLRGLSVEVRQRLSELRPKTLGQASRISGVTPAAVSLLAIYLRKNGRSNLKKAIAQ